MKIVKLTKEMQARPVLARVDLYSKASHTYTGDDETAYIGFDNWDKYLEYKQLMGNKLEESGIHYFKAKGYVLVFFKRVALSYWKSLLPQYRLDLELKHVKNKDKYKKVEDAYWKEYSKEESAKKLEAGFVNYKYPMDLKSIKGSLNQLLTPDVVKYLGDGSRAWGYLGHGWRQHYMDEYMEQTIIRLQKALVGRTGDFDVVNPLATWLTSSYARHWMDSQEDKTKNEFKAAFKKLYRDVLVEQYPVENFKKFIEKALNIQE